MAVKINVGDVLELKKQHPCGGKTFEVMRAGMDFRVKCQTCGAQIWIDRPALEKRIRKIMPQKTPETADGTPGSEAVTGTGTGAGKETRE